jgi:hypothetical protein
MRDIFRIDIMMITRIYSMYYKYDIFLAVGRNFHHL